MWLLGSELRPGRDGDDGVFVRFPSSRLCGSDLDEHGRLVWVLPEELHPLSCAERRFRVYFKGKLCLREEGVCGSGT